MTFGCVSGIVLPVIYGTEWCFRRWKKKRDHNDGDENNPPGGDTPDNDPGSGPPDVAVEMVTVDRPMTNSSDRESDNVEEDIEPPAQEAVAAVPRPLKPPPEIPPVEVPEPIHVGIPTIVVPPSYNEATLGH